MATRGVKQLQTLKIFYCNYGGSSAAARDYIATGKIVEFAKKNPTVQVIGELRNGKHPFVRAEYLSGFPKQVCVKNETIRRIEEVIHMLNNSSGRKIKKIEGSTQTDKPSIQGVWTPMLDIVQKKFKIEMISSKP
jgi:large subunit ribosomal protein L43